MKYSLVIFVQVLLSLYVFPAHAQEFFSDSANEMKKRSRGNEGSNQSASNSARPTRGSSSAASSTSSGTSRSTSSGTSSSTSSGATSTSASSTTSSSASGSTSNAGGSTSTSSSDVHPIQSTNQRSQLRTARFPTSRAQAGNAGSQRRRPAGIVIREPSTTSRLNTRPHRSRDEEYRLRVREKANFARKAHHAQHLRSSRFTHPDRYTQHISNRRRTQDQITAHIRARQSSQSQSAATRYSSRIARHRERILTADTPSTSTQPPSRQRSSRARLFHSGSQDQVVPDFHTRQSTNQLSGRRRGRELISTPAVRVPDAERLHPQASPHMTPSIPTIREQSRRESRTSRLATASSQQPETSSLRRSREDLIIVQHPSHPGRPIFGVAYEAPFEEDRKGKKRKTD
ncbi:uncharacterized protein FA14DRAFT_157718 [Meira miltonrushii]|uniref:REJ domain-containing protein n=1 Tax=Meira miltonrushii TaxID=1280837 RepID=A0A316V628_9BASI|nr:uncharacterized protein FA14DRAFT_157718 [Meira miltonrushii]PWN33037.1 hypothetical protein FA14DRAFT_157718 [Meira miltonrushii]